MLALTCNHLKMHELTECNQKQSESGSVCMARTLTEYYVPIGL